MAPTPPLRPYPAYKPSGMPWLDSVPGHWEVRRIKSLYREVDERSSTGSEELMSVSHKTGVTRRKQNVTMFLAESNVGHKVCRPGDIVVNTMWAYMAALGVARLEGLVSPSYGVYRPLDNNALDDDYIDSLLRTEAYRSAYLSRSTGITASRLRLYAGSFLSIPLLRPPLPEQRAIVRYLDYVDRRIRRYVSAKRRLIELLEEERGAIVTQAVTRGLDLNVQLRPSGVEWLGDVPAHWEVRRIGTLARTLNGATPSTSNASYWEGDIAWITPEDLGKLDSRYVDRSARRITEEGYQASGTTLAPIGSIAVSTRAPIGHLGILRTAACVNQGCRLLVPASEVLSEFLHYALVSTRDTLSSFGQGSTFSELSRHRLAGFRVSLPPLPEQRAIVEYLDTATADIDTAIARASQQIELMEEYRTRLVADVVTGKLDVRDAAKLLPDREVGDNWPEGGLLADLPDGDDGIPESPVEGLTIESEVPR